MGIILFNYAKTTLNHPLNNESFRPLMGIILFNYYSMCVLLVVSVCLVFPSPNGDYFI